MNDKMTNNHTEEDIARTLTQVAEQTHANAQFTAELEARLRSAHQPNAGWRLAFNQVSPTLRWVGLMIVLALVLSWSIRTLIPVPQPAEENTPSTPVPSTPLPDGGQDPTPAPEGEGIEFRNAQLFMNVDLPDSPASAAIYQVIAPQPATAEYAQSLARQFGIVGDVYRAAGLLPDTTAFMVTDGRQQLVVFGENNYSYTSDMVADSRTYDGAAHANAEAIIREFLQSRGFSTNVIISDSGTLGGYILRQLTPDGLPIEYHNYSQPAIRIRLTDTGEVLGMNVILVNYEPAGLGPFEIISAEEALQRVLDDDLTGGKFETSHGGAPDANYVPPVTWYREFPDGQTVTIHGNVSSNPAVQPGKPAIVFIDTVQAVGNIRGMDTLETHTFVQAAGQYIVEGGVRRFRVDAWSADVQGAYAFGWARRQGDQVILVNEEGGSTEYVLMDPPSDLPLDITFPDASIAVNGALTDGQLDWTTITYYPDGTTGGGGGGGGGLGFYQLNLSGTPIPFPTALTAASGTEYTPAELASFLKHTVKEGDTLASIASTYNVSVSELSRANNLADANVIAAGWSLILPGVPGPTRLDGEDGTLHVQIFEKPDGRLREAYTFVSRNDQVYYELKGEALGQLQEVANRPIKIWGSISYDESGAPLLTFERFESPYPDLQFEVLTGTQQSIDIDGTSAVLFTTAGTTYIQLIPSGGYPDYSMYDGTGEIHLEVLRLPGESYAGYPALRVFNSGPAVNSVTGEEMPLPRLAEEILVMPDPFGNGDSYVFPDVIIERVELIYVTNHPAYPVSEVSNGPPAQPYMQPVWHFQGRYSDGTVIDILVQALGQRYLSPDLAPYQAPG